MRGLLLMLPFGAYCAGTAALERDDSPECVGCYHKVFKNAVTQEFVRDFIAEIGRQEWDTTSDSVDGYNQHTIDVIDHAKVTNDPLNALLMTQMPRIYAWLNSEYPGFPHHLDWVFIRRYSPGTRLELQPHLDENNHTVNIPLNTDFEGSNLYFIRRPELNNPKDNYSPVPFREWFEATPKPVFNSTKFFIPYYAPGDALVHDNTVYHGIGPVTSGTKFSLVLFFDMPDYTNPKHFRAVFLNTRDRSARLLFKFHKDRPPMVVYEDWRPGQYIVEGTYDKHLYMVEDKETGNVIKFFSMRTKSEDEISLHMVSAADDASERPEISSGVQLTVEEMREIEEKYTPSAQREPMQGA